MRDRLWGILLIAVSLCIGLWSLGQTIGWEIIPQLIGVVAMTLGLCFLMLLGVFLIVPPRK